MREFKGLLIGDPGVGKDSILNRLIDNHFLPTVSTIGVAFRVKHYSNAKINFWNTSGQRKYNDVIKMYFRNTDVCIIVYDMTSQESFDNCKFWLNCFRTSHTGKAQIYVLANKIDLMSKRQLHNQTQLLNEYSYMEKIIPGIVSAKTGAGISDFFDTIMTNLMKVDPPNDLIEMDHEPTPAQDCRCIIL